MPLDLRASLERFFRDRRRRSPLIEKVVVDGASAAHVWFKPGQRIDQNPEPPAGAHRGKIRVAHEVHGIVEYTLDSLIEEAPNYFRAAFISGSVIEPTYVGPRYMVYMGGGNLRDERRFKLLEGTRHYRVEDL
jgi:hypothetical protein